MYVDRIYKSRINPLLNEIREAIAELENAQEAESLAEADYIEAAIARTNAAQSKLDTLYKEIKKESKI